MQPGTTMRSQRVHPLAAAIGTLCVAYFALWACAPAAFLRPPVPMAEGDHHEVAFGGSWNGSAGPTDSSSQIGLGWGGQASYAYHFDGDHFVLGGTLFGGTSSLVGGGVQLRVNAVQAERFRLAVDAEGGFLWGALGLPMAFRLADHTWLYTAPSGGLRVGGIARLPVGVSIGLGEHWLLTPELALTYGGYANGISEGYGGLGWQGAFGATGRF